MGKIETILRQKLEARLKPLGLELANESPMHGLPLEAEKHFRVIAVSAAFAGLARIERHRLVNEIVAEELRTHVHAFTLQAFTPEEWTAKNGQTFSSPECLGGGKREGLK
jgi:BolA family transcriptional regulator, general stress-responsive regulator